MKLRVGGWNRSIGAIVVALAMAVAIAAAIACHPEAAEDGEATEAPPTATVVMPSPTPTQAPAAVLEPASTATPEPTSTPISTPTLAPTPEPTPTPALTPDPPSVQEVLNAAAAAMETLETGSVRWEGEVTGGPIEGQLVVYGDFQAPDRSRFTTVITAGSVSIEYDSIVIGAEAYLENPFNGAWEASPEPLGTLGEGEHLGELNLALEPEAIDLIVLAGVEELNGESVYYLQGQLPADAVAALVGDPSIEDDALGAPVDMEIWIGVADFLVRKLGVRFQVTDPRTGSNMTAQTVMTFSDYGKPVDIQAPEVEERDRGFWTGGDDHGDDPASATQISAGETAEGAIDDILDYDYFVFQAEEGQSYQIDAALGTLADSALTLYDAEGFEEAWNDDYNDTWRRRSRGWRPAPASTSLRWRASTA